jgi:hypothetical protein
MKKDILSVIVPASFLYPDISMIIYRPVTSSVLSLNTADKSNRLHNTV